MKFVFFSLRFVFVILLAAASSLYAQSETIPYTTSIAPADPNMKTVPSQESSGSKDSSGKTLLINFNNVSIIEFLRFISKMSNKNFVFNEADLQFNVTIVSEEPTTIENVMTALLQELRIHGLSLMEQGNNLIIHANPGVNAISKVVGDSGEEPSSMNETEIVTRLFRLSTIEAGKVASILKPLTSAQALVEVLQETNHLIITDLASNVAKIADLLKNIDSPNSGLVIGQYVVRNTSTANLIALAEQIMQPISGDQTLIFVPHPSARSIFVISNPYLVERTLSILGYLDQNQGTTRIFNLDELKYSKQQPLPSAQGMPVQEAGRWELDPSGNWIFKTGLPQDAEKGNVPPQGEWSTDAQGNWNFRAFPPGYETPAGVTGVKAKEQPEGNWVLDSQGSWVFQLAPNKPISPERLARGAAATAELPAGHIERTKFFIYKLLYRNGEHIQEALNKIAISLQNTTSSNADLIAAIESIQWLETSNSMIITGSSDALRKIEELLKEIDTPLRQVFIDMLILDTTLDDSLRFGVDWSSRFGGGNTAGGESFLQLGSTLPTAMNTTVPPLTPEAGNMFQDEGFHLGIIGRNLTHNGQIFRSLGALVSALHSRDQTKVVLNPKLVTEDNHTAEIFVGINTPFPTQAIANDFGTIITQNFEYRDVGTTLRVTPLIGENGIITLTIEQETSNIVPTLQAAINNQGPTTRKNTTRTKVHLPNKYFLVLSGQLEDALSNDRSQVPCLGGIPFLGGAFSDKRDRNTRRNLMLFLRPQIVDSEEEIQNLTKHQQDVYRYKNQVKPSWKYEVDEALDFFNLPSSGECCAPEGF